MIDIKKTSKFVKRQRVAFLGSIDDNNFPNMKAMLRPRLCDGLKCFYFSTNTSSLRVQQYQKNDKGCVYFYHKGIIHYEGVMLIGHVEVLSDQETKNKFWRFGDKIFYSKGVTDPDYCIIKFTAIEGRHYSDLKTESFTL